MHLACLRAYLFGPLGFHVDIFEELVDAVIRQDLGVENLYSSFDSVASAQFVENAHRSLHGAGRLHCCRLHCLDATGVYEVVGGRCHGAGDEKELGRRAQDRGF